MMNVRATVTAADTIESTKTTIALPTLSSFMSTSTRTAVAVDAASILNKRRTVYCDTGRLLWLYLRLQRLDSLHFAGRHDDKTIFGCQ